MLYWWNKSVGIWFWQWWYEFNQFENNPERTKTKRKASKQTNKWSNRYDVPIYWCGRHFGSADGSRPRLLLWINTFLIDVANSLLIESFYAILGNTPQLLSIGFWLDWCPLHRHEVNFKLCAELFSILANITPSMRFCWSETANCCFISGVAMN